MATISYTNGYAYLYTTNPSNVIANDSTFTVTKPAWTVKGMNDVSGSRYFYFGNEYSLNSSIEVYPDDEIYTRTEFPNQRTNSVANGATLATIASSSVTLQTSDFFSYRNKASRTATVNIVAEVVEAYIINLGHFAGVGSPSPLIVASCTVTLNAPPTFDTTQVSFDTAYVYAGYTTASVTVSNTDAKYGGDISSVVFTIGNQSTTGTGDGPLSIPLSAGGTFTPTVAVTDSRGQTTTTALDPITVSVYTAPQTSFTLERTNSSGTADDEGTYAVATASFNWTDAVATLSQPTVTAVDSSGVPISVTTTWYTDRALTTAVNWPSTSSWSTPKVLYGKIGTLPVNESSQITVTPNDSKSSGTAQSQTLAPAFYTVDFLAGGHGIAFGLPATKTGVLECDFDAEFNKNVRLGLDTTATSGTDYEIYTALQSLGWDSDVIV